jgi:serine/threonine-protein kinase
MINRAGAVKVMDFGIARALGEGQNVTQTAAVIGTAQYLSPEQARGEAVDARSDVYAAGCVLFELLTGEPPFTGDTPVAVAYQHVREDPRRPSEVNPNIPPELDSVVLKALSKNPANRYQSAAEMRADLVRVRSGQAPMAPAVMSEDERTAMLAPPPTGPTRRINGGGRHGTAPPAPEYYDDYDEPRRSTGRTIGIAALVAAALGINGIVAFQLLSGPPAAQQVTIPATLIGQTEQAATNALISAKLQVAREEVESTPEQKGTVIQTNPAPGAQVAERSLVTLSIGKGPASVPVPNLQGKTVAEPTALLKEKGLQLGNQSQTETDDPSLVGKIVKSTPNGGEDVPGDSKVDVQVGVQPSGDPLEDYAGRSVEDVESDLRSKGYNPQRNGADGDDQVTGTSPAAGTRVPDGATVTILTNGNGNGGNTGTKQVPSVRGLSESDAKSQLKSAGFTNVRTQTQQVANANQDGRVLAQSPEGGQNADTGSQVTLLVGRFGNGNNGFLGN